MGGTAKPYDLGGEQELANYDKAGFLDCWGYCTFLNQLSQIKTSALMRIDPVGEMLDLTLLPTLYIWVWLARVPKQNLIQ